MEQIGNWHLLKTWPDVFDDIINGKKTYEVRVNDRDYKHGDVLVLREYIPLGQDGYKYFGPLSDRRSGYTGRVFIVCVVHITHSHELPKSDNTKTMDVAAVPEKCQQYLTKPPRLAIMGIMPWIQQNYQEDRVDTGKIFFEQYEK